MAFRLFAPPAALLGVGLGYYHTAHRRPALLQPLRCDFAPSWGFPQPWSFRTKQMAPPPKNRSGFNPIIYRQISTGSLVGLAMGLMVAKFGKMLCLVVGAAMMIVEILAREGIDIIPPGKVKQWVQEMDIRGLILKNSAFKVSFGTTFIIASFYG